MNNPHGVYITTNPPRFKVWASPREQATINSTEPHSILTMAHISTDKNISLPSRFPVKVLIVAKAEPISSSFLVTRHANFPVKFVAPLMCFDSISRDLTLKLSLASLTITPFGPGTENSTFGVRVSKRSATTRSWTRRHAEARGRWRLHDHVIPLTLADREA